MVGPAELEEGAKSAWPFLAWWTQALTSGDMGTVACERPAKELGMRE